MRRVLIAILAFVAACSQPPASTESPNPPAASDNSAAIISVLTPLVAAEIGAPVRLEVRRLNVQDEWAWIAVNTLQPDGSAIAWSATALASRYENGAMDEGGGAYALLKQENGAWRLVTHVVAPTDMAWASWPREYGAPATIMEIAD